MDIDLLYLQIDRVIRFLVLVVLCLSLSLSLSVARALRLRLGVADRRYGRFRHCFVFRCVVRSLIVTARSAIQFDGVCKYSRLFATRTLAKQARIPISTRVLVQFRSTIGTNSSTNRWRVETISLRFDRRDSILLSTRRVQPRNLYTESKNSFVAFTVSSPPNSCLGPILAANKRYATTVRR